MKINIFWFRRDLRLKDNIGLNHALNGDLPVLAVFIYDTEIIDELPADDPRINFIHDTLFSIQKDLQKYNSSLYSVKGSPEVVWENLIRSFDINEVFINKDYEPYAIKRDSGISSLLARNNIRLTSFKDQVIFEENEILKSDNEPYTVFTPYKNKWLQHISWKLPLEEEEDINSERFFKCNLDFPSLEKNEFKSSKIKVRPFDLSVILNYDKHRDIPAEDLTTYLGPHLRFGTISIRTLVNKASAENQVFLNELIWREFFMQILFHFPQVVTENFKSRYDNIQWSNNEADFEKWCNGETGYPFVDAGMRQLNRSGYMHNRVRMITAGFLCKHILIDWRWGEAYFASKLLDYELSSNNGNWQWAAGTGCDSAPYFRIFNPDIQMLKFDRDKKYVERWIEEFHSSDYPQPMIEQNFARRRAVETYRSGLK